MDKFYWWFRLWFVLHEFSESCLFDRKHGVVTKLIFGDGCFVLRMVFETFDHIVDVVLHFWDKIKATDQASEPWCIAT